MQTEHFQTVVPRARDYLDSDARFCRIGASLFDLYGATELDSKELEDRNARLAGWWIAERVFERNSAGPSFLCITPVANRPFSKIHVLIRSDEVPIGSGISFPKGDRHNLDEHLARIFSKELYFREKVLLLWPHMRGQESATLDVMFSPRDNPVEFPGASFIKIHFSRTDESAVPADVQDIFDKWNRSVLPRNLGNLPVLMEGSRNMGETLQGTSGEAFSAVRQRDEEIANRSPLED